MNDNEQKKRMIRARLIRLPIFLGIVFLFAWMFRWEIVAGSGTGGGVQRVMVQDPTGLSFIDDIDTSGVYFKLDRWTGTSYVCDFTGCNES